MTPEQAYQNGAAFGAWLADFVLYSFLPLLMFAALCVGIAILRMPRLYTFAAVALSFGLFIVGTALLWTLFPI